MKTHVFFDIEKIAMDKLKDKWSHLYTFGYPVEPFPISYKKDLDNIKIGLIESVKWQSEQIPLIIEKYLETAFISNEKGYLNPKKWFEEYQKNQQ
jgi:hypothetical protein